MQRFHDTRALAPQHRGAAVAMGNFDGVHLGHQSVLALAHAAAVMLSAPFGVITFEPENEWDVAAGTLLLEEAGGSAHDGAGQLLRYNQPLPRFGGFIATVQGFPDHLTSQVRQLPRSAR